MTEQPVSFKLERVSARHLIQMSPDRLHREYAPRMKRRFRHAPDLEEVGYL